MVVTYTNKEIDRLKIFFEEIVRHGMRKWESARMIHIYQDLGDWYQSRNPGGGQGWR